MTVLNLTTIRNHKRWLDSNGARGVRLHDVVGCTWRAKHGLYDRDLSWADLSGAHLNRLKLCDVSLDSADMAGITLRNAVLQKCSMTGARLIDADLQDVEVYNTFISFTSMRRVHAPESKWYNTKFINVDFTQAQFSAASLIECTFRNCIMHGVDFSYTDRSLEFIDCIGVTELEVNEYRPFRLYAFEGYSDGPRFQSGCRWFTLEQALNHWSPENARKRVDIMLMQQRYPVTAASYIRAIKKYMKTRTAQ